MNIYSFFAVLKAKINPPVDMSLEYERAEQWLKKFYSIVDLGCGTNPHPNASVAVDKYIDPIHREYGLNKTISVEEIENNGCRFIEADFENLPFPDKEFELAYSHHVVEHLENPIKACEEMQRVAERGIILCPSAFSEIMFGRKYHKWFCYHREDRLLFIEKETREDRPFGDGPKIIDGKIVRGKKCNPFDILLNEGNWYHGLQKYSRLSKMLRKYWNGHHCIMENVFLWEKSFRVLVVYKDGTVETLN